ncbi:hypothetical protein [Bdellovibrio sp. GT3]|uniref:hypothetical protein n=1 Tax=Bdellovibrio sp. GT3 TaxID=3136282 RepID=UPI0030F1DD01
MKKLSTLILTIAMTLTASLAKADVAPDLPNNRHIFPVRMNNGGKWHFGHTEIPGKQVLAMKFNISSSSGWAIQAANFYGANVNIVGLELEQGPLDGAAVYFAVNRQMNVGLGESVVFQAIQDFAKFEVTVYYTAIDDTLPASLVCFQQPFPDEFDLRNFRGF